MMPMNGKNGAGAGPWDIHPAYAVPDGAIEETFDFSIDITTAAGALQRDQPLRVDADADFILRSMVGEIVSGAGVTWIRFTDPAGFPSSSDFMIFDEFVSNGTGSNIPCPWWPQMRIPANGLLLIDTWEKTGNHTSTIRLSVQGVKRFTQEQYRRCVGGIW